jgi:hypothetical protein
MKKNTKKQKIRNPEEKAMLDFIFKTLGDLGCTGGIVFADDDPNGQATAITKNKKGEFVEETGKVKDICPEKNP